MDENSAIQQIELQYSLKFKDKQFDSIKSILQSRDTFIVLPTGYGKSRIYFHLPELFEMITGEKSCILVISPLQALMLDQVEKLTRLGIKATVVGECQKDKGVVDNISAGDYSVVFSSPEAALLPGIWRRSFTSGLFNDHMKALIIDEAHCITEWGGEFRQEFSRLAELRSILPEGTPFVALTATATKEMQTEIIKKLNMVPEETRTISVLPDRTNITYIVKKTTKNFSELQWLLDDVRQNGRDAKKTIIYCRNISSGASLFQHFFLELSESVKDLDTRHIAMFHRSTADINKAHVLAEFPQPGSNLRIVFATIAFGMGVDIPDVDQIIHWGAPRGLEQFTQESGRAGRDGRDAMSMIFYSSYDLAKGACRESVVDFCRPKRCCREILNNYFSLDDENDTQSKVHSCKCCSFCSLACDCGSCNVFDNISPTSQTCKEEDDDTDIHRQISESQYNLLRENILDLRDVFIDEGSPCALFLVDSAINEILCNAAYLFCEDDIISLGLGNPELAKELLLTIEDII